MSGAWDGDGAWGWEETAGSGCICAQEARAGSVRVCCADRQCQQGSRWGPQTAQETTGIHIYTHYKWAWASLLNAGDICGFNLYFCMWNKTVRAHAVSGMSFSILLCRPRWKIRWESLRICVCPEMRLLTRPKKTSARSRAWRLKSCSCMRFVLFDQNRAATRVNLIVSLG